MTEAVRIIKKYPNRRLYDTESSAYVTLEGIRRLVLAGSPFKVVDNKTGADITRAILLQIISEREEGERRSLPPTCCRVLSAFTAIRCSRRGFWGNIYSRAWISFWTSKIASVRRLIRLPSCRR